MVVRAYRRAGIDLQKLIHEDIAANPSAYPTYANTKKPDPNIDHRRVPNQAVFFRRKGFSLSKSAENPNLWEPGDIVDWKLPGGRDHTGVLTDKLDPQGFPYVVHNIGQGPREEDVLRTGTWKISGHYRCPSHNMSGRIASSPRLAASQTAYHRLK